MKNLKTRLVVLLLSTLCLLTGAFAQFTPSQDSYTFSSKAGQNFGTAQALQVESALFSHAIANSYIQFDLSSIPSSYTGANVAKASLKLFVNGLSGAGGSFNVDLVNGTWTEFGIKYNNAPALGTTIASSIPLTTANVNDYVIVDVTSAVQAWLNGTQSNDGIALVANSGLGVLFDSKESTTTSHPPELDIVFTSGGGTITGVTTSNGSGLIGGGTTGNLNLSLINSCSIGQVLAWNGADSGGWLCATVTGGGGGVTSVGGGLGVIASPNPITTTGALSIDTAVVPQLGAANTFTGMLTAAGGAVLPPIGGTPATGGSPSNPLDLTASASDGSSNTNQTFRWQATNVDGATPSANLNLLFGAGSDTPQPTGLSVAPNGIITFAQNQTFQGGGGSGITTVVAGTGLTGGGSTPTVTLNVNQGVVAFQTDLTAGINTAETFATTAANTAQTTAENYANSTFVPLTAEGAFATLGANAFNGGQTIMGGSVGIGTTAPQATLDVNGTVNAATSFQIAGNPFGYGSSANKNAYLGFAGNINNGSTGTFNTTATGYQALFNNTGSGNTANGAGALYSNQGPTKSNPFAGTQNTANGASALYSNTTGFFNTASGFLALQNNISGFANTASGTAALQNNTAGNNNSAFGYLAGPDPNVTTPLNNATAIGAYADVTVPNALVLGGITGVNQCTAQNNCASVNVGIGTTAPAHPLDVNGVIRSSTGGFMFPDGSVQTKAASGGGGTVTSVGSGFGLTGGPIITSGSLTIDTSVVPQLTSSNTFNGSITALSFIGNGAQLTNVNAATLGGFSPGTFATLGANAFTGNQTITGGSVGIGTTTPQATLDVNGVINAATSFNIGGTPFAFGSAFNQNAFLGFAGNTTTTGQFNAGTGSQALYSNTSGSYNTASGEQALYSNTQGSANTAAGNTALYSNLTGHDNTAVGNAALFPNTGSFNTASGSAALSNNTSGNNNTASGYNSLSTNSTGSYNTAMGILAGQSLDGSYMSASNNTFLGAGSAVSTGTLNNATAIGSNSEVEESNALVLGAITGVNGGTSVNVGIGTTMPAYPLDVNGIIRSAGGFKFPDGTVQTTAASSGGGGGSGTVTSVATGIGLTGGPITSSGTLSINTSVVPQLGAANTFAGNNTFSGTNTFTGNTTAASLSATNLTTTGSISGGNIYGTALYLNGNGQPFAYTSGSGGGDNAFLGFSGIFTSKFSPGDFNTAVGFGALNNNGGGGGFNVSSNNTAIGSSALLANTTGGLNTASGSNALRNNVTGSINTAVGFGAGPDSASTGLNNSTAIGAYAVVSQDNSLVLGSIANLNGCSTNGLPACQSAKVGIGTATPGATLDVEAPSGTPPPTVNFGSVSNPATLTVNGSVSNPATLTVNGNLTVTGTCTGCGGSGGGGGTITGVTAGTGLSGGGTSGNVTLNLNTAVVPELTAANTFTGTQTFTVPAGDGIVAQTAGSSNVGISGSNTSAVGVGPGVAGYTNSSLGSGVVGTNRSTSTLGGGYGVQGLSFNPAVPSVGGVNNSTVAGSAYGVFGQSFGPTGTGVYGTGIGSGVTGNAVSPAGSGVVGTNFSTSGNAYGLYGQSSSPTGTGVFGTGNNAGVYGTGSGSGVTGTTSSPTGTGVVGVNSAGGYAGYFQGNVAITSNATVTGTLAIGGDKPMSHSPRMTFSGTVANFTTSQFQPAGYFIPDEPIVITRFTAATGSADNNQCGTNSQMGFIAGGNPLPYFITTGAFVGYADSGPLNVLVAAGTPVQIVGLEANGLIVGCQSGGNMTATVQYAMQ